MAGRKAKAKIKAPKPARKAAKKKSAAKTAPRQKSAPKTSGVLPASDAHLLAILRASPIGAVVSQMDGEVLFANDAATTFFSVGRDGAIGSRTASFFADPHARDHHVAMLRKRGVVERAEMLMRTAAGAEKIALI